MVCLGAAAIAVALIRPGYCHDTAPGVQQGGMWGAFGLAFVLWLIGAGMIGEVQAAPRTKPALAALALAEVGLAIAIFVYYRHQTVHYFDCG
jgi:hypothetical protein